MRSRGASAIFRCIGPVSAQSMIDSAAAATNSVGTVMRGQAM